MIRPRYLFYTAIIIILCGFSLLANSEGARTAKAIVSKR